MGDTQGQNLESQDLEGMTKAIGLGVFGTVAATTAALGFRSLDREQLSTVQRALVQTGLFLIIVAVGALIVYLISAQTSEWREDRADKQTTQRSYRRRLALVLEETATVVAILREERTIYSWTQQVPGPLAAIRAELGTLARNLAGYASDGMPLFADSAAIEAELDAAGALLDEVIDEFEREAPALTDPRLSDAAVQARLRELPALRKLVDDEHTLPAFERELYHALELIDA